MVSSQWPKLPAFWLLQVRNSGPNRKSQIYLSRGPGHFAAAQDVEVQVRDGFAGVRAVVEDEAVAVFEAELFGDFCGFQEQMSEDGVVCRFCFSDARDGLLRYDENMDRCLGFDVVESDDPVVLVNDGGRDFACYNFFKQRFTHVQYPGAKWWEFGLTVAPSILKRN